MQHEKHSYQFTPKEHKLGLSHIQSPTLYSK